MPTLPKGKDRPWIPKRPKTHRQTDNSAFYNSKQWRALRNWYIKELTDTLKKESDEMKKQSKKR